MRHWRLIGTLAAVVAFSAVITSQTPSGHALFEQALAKERVEGNLQEAIRLYERVVAEFTSDRALAAQALVQVGLCYEKLGRDEAVRAYERLVRDFADQEDAVEQARARLAALRRPAPGAAAVATMPLARPFPRVDGTLLVNGLSPDGTKAAFINYDKGQNLTVYDATSQQTTRLTEFDWTPGSSWVILPVWSRDGRQIAYLQGDNRSSVWELRVLTLAGKSSVVSRNETGPMIPGGWLPDGSAIAVTFVRPDRTATIGLVPTDGGPFIPLRSISGWSGRYAPPASVSPDGRWIAFTEGSSRDIHVISRDGRTAHRITDHPANDDLPMWSPDGRHLAFVSDRNGSVAIWAVAIKDGQPAAEPVRVKDGMQVAYLLGWTTRGLVYSEDQQTDDIYTVPVDPSSGTPIGSPRLIPYRRTGQNIEPEWSPDGKYLAFVSSPAERDRRTIVLVPSDGGEPREFLTPAQRIWDLRWFGDSRGLGFTGHDARGERTLFRLTLATGELKTYPLPATAAGMDWNGMYFDWNADGSRYFYVWQDSVADSDFRIVERDLQSDRERIVLREGAKSLNTCCSSYRGLRFSPGRRLLAFRSSREDHGIVVLDIDTGRTRVVHDRAVGETYTYTDADRLGRQTWSPDGRALLVLRTENTGTDKQAMDLRLIPVDGGEVRRIPLGAELTRLLSPSRGAARPRVVDDSVVWSPDGGRLAFALRASQLETWVLENPLALAGSAGASTRK